MLKFKPIEISDKSVIDSHLKKYSQTCDRTFVNLFCWQHHYSTMWAEYDNWIIIRACINGERRVAYIPVTSVENPDYNEILHVLNEDAKLHNQPLTMMGLSDFECEQIRKCCSNCFIFDKNRDFADYIYKTEDLRTLKGRKFAQKRNHVNKFKSLYSFHYEPITLSNIRDCLELESDWLKQHPNDESVLSEYKTIKSAFDNFDALELIGGALYVDNQIVAFTYGSELNNDTFCTHVEKADIRYEGVYQMINYLFAQNLPDKYLYINREEDMGLVGLRKSKLSYEPDRLEFKTTALLQCDDIENIINIWFKCFGDDPTVYQFLSRYYFEHCSFLKKVDNKIVAMLFVIPCKTNLGNAAYLYGVATDPDFQHRGFSTNLLNEFIDKCKKDNFDFAFLIPESVKIIDFYAKFGFLETDKNVIFNSDMDLGTGNQNNDKALVLLFNQDIDVQNIESISCTPVL